MNKYFNKKTIVDGIKFDSKKEAKRYIELKILKRAGKIRDLEIQAEFILQPKYKNAKGENIRAITYKADFLYYDIEKDMYVVEDVKASEHFKTEVYKIKKKIFEYKYPNLTINEIY